MQIIWFPLTLLCALSLATSDALTKKALAARHNEYLFAWLRLLLMLPPLALLLLAIPVPQIAPEFLPTVLTALPLELTALILYFKALKHSPLGLTVPFLSLTPVFLLVIPYLILGERLSQTGGIGIVLIAVGSYTLNLSSRQEGWMTPFKAILRERGSLYMVGVAIIYSLTATLCKKAITLTSPLFFAGLYPMLLFLRLTPVALWKGRGELRQMLRTGILQAAIFPALFSFVEVVTGIVALGLINVAYMIAVKRLSLLVGILYGHFMFREKGLRERLAGGILMVLGVTLIVLGGR